jgi:hypothetical protein
MRADHGRMVGTRLTLLRIARILAPLDAAQDIDCCRGTSVAHVA